MFAQSCLLDVLAQCLHILENKSERISILLKIVHIYKVYFLVEVTLALYDTSKDNVCF